MVVYAALGALLLAMRHGRLAAVTVLVAPAGTVVAYLGLKTLFARNRPSGIGNLIEGTYSFPSAHATTSAAVCCGWIAGLCIAAIAGLLHQLSRRVDGRRSLDQRCT